MPERKPNQFARVFAVLTLILAAAVVVFTIATTDNSSDSDGDGDEVNGDRNAGEPTAKGERAIEEGVWIVREGDTLVSISEATAIDLDLLVELNPDLDPQTLSTGQRIALREGLTEGGSTSSSSDGDGDTITEGSGIGDGVGGDDLSDTDNAGESDGIPGN